MCSTTIRKPDMLALPSHGVEQEMMSMDTCENAGSKAPADQPEVRTILSSGPTSEKRPRVQPDRSFPPGEASDKAQAKSKHGAAGKSSASRGRKRARQSRDSDINSDEECNKEEQRQLCLLYTSPSPRDLSTSRMPSSA